MFRDSNKIYEMFGLLQEKELDQCAHTSQTHN